MKDIINKIKDTLKCKCWKYRYHEIIIDILKKRIQMSEIKHAIAVGEVIQEITTKKFIKLKHWKKLSPKSLDRAIDVHNRYTTGKKFDFKQILSILNSISIRIINAGGSKGILNSIVKGLAVTHPAFGIANELIKIYNDTKYRKGL